MNDTLILLAAAALLVRVGQTLYTCGISRSKNAASAMARCLFDICLTVLAFWAIGAAILLQPRSNWFHIESSLLFGNDLSANRAAGIFSLATAVLIATGSLVGTLAERSRFFAAAAASLLLAVLIIPVAGSWVRTGWLLDLHFIDVAGASWLHLAAGITAGVGAYFVGPRNGKYHRDGSASMIPGHSIPLAAAGVMLMFAGWVPYVLSFSMPHQHAGLGPAALNVLLAGAAAGFSATLFSQFRYGKPDSLLALLGFLGGLVAITASAGKVGTLPAVFIGAVAGILIPLASIYLDLILKIDDPAGAIAVHGLGGLWGALAAGQFGTTNLDFANRIKQLGVQALGIAAIALLTFALTIALFYTLKKMNRLRSKEADEFDGLDLAEHDIGAYPDFQQTTIKSYHLREA
jgi:Amt family ammonium transporter